MNVNYYYFLEIPIFLVLNPDILIPIFRDLDSFTRKRIIFGENTENSDLWSYVRLRLRNYLV